MIIRLELRLELELELELERVTRAPIIFITAWRTGENRAKAESLKADGFLAKPISHHDFVEQLTAVLGKPARRLTEV